MSRADDPSVVRVVLGVSGGIAAYKACELLRRLTESGHDVTVVPTAAALEFVGAPTWAALSGKPVASDVWADVEQVPHVRIGQAADLVVVAPATADLLARAAHGLADDLLTNVLLTARCPVLLAPAMHTEMWEHPATQTNVTTLRDRGVSVLEPAEGRLTGADSGKGRLPEPADIFAACLAALGLDTPSLRSGCSTTGEDTPSLRSHPTNGEDAASLRSHPTTGGDTPSLRSHPTTGGDTPPPRSAGAITEVPTNEDLVDRRVVVSAGGTREPLDPVRFLGNRSSGRQGYALAEVAAARGARVTLVAANVSLPDPAGVTVVPVETTEQLREAVLRAADDADAVVMAAAPADFRPVSVSDAKIKKSTDGSPAAIELVQNPDILAELSHDRRRPHQVVVGFAAETGDDSGSVVDLARAKLERKGCDLLVVNDVGSGAVFGTTDNQAVILSVHGEPVDVPLGSKGALAEVIWTLIARQFVA